LTRDERYKALARNLLNNIWTSGEEFGQEFWGKESNQAMKNMIHAVAIIASTTRVAEHLGSIVPKTLGLHQNYPNPFNPETTIDYTLPEKSLVQMTIYDMLGRRLRMRSRQQVNIKCVGMAATTMDAVWSAGCIFIILKRQHFNKRARCCCCRDSSKKYLKPNHLEIVMRHKILIRALFVVLFVLGCNRETPQEPITPQQNEDDVATIIQNLQEFTQNPASGVTKIAGGRRVVVIPAGSEDALAAAIAEVREGGVILLRAGEHKESGTVTVDHRVTIVGEPGAILVADTKPLATVQPALHLLSAGRAIVWGLDFRPKETVGGTAILLENSPNALIGHNIMRDYQYGVLIEHSDHASIWRNTIIATSAWRSGELAAVYGIVAINGKHVEIGKNDVSNAFFGIWVCDKNGEVEQNNLHGNYIGLIFCKVAEFDFTLPGGKPAPADFTATNWRATGNNATDNLDAGYLVIDGANDNLLESNNGSNNGTYDLDLTGDTYRFGFLTPKSVNNKVVAGQFQNVIIKNCGENNTIIGGQLVDNTQDPCL